MKTDMTIQDWKKSILADIVIMRGRELPLITANGLERIFDSCGEQTARAAVRRLRDRDTLPSNIVGVIEREIAVIEAEKREQDEWKIHTDDSGTSEECTALMEFLTELISWHDLGMVKRNPSGTAIPMSIDEYVAANRPATWSPIVDHWLKGFVKAYNEDKEMPGALLNFLMMYNINLKKVKQERMAQVSPACEAPQEFPGKMVFS